MFHARDALKKGQFMASESHIFNHTQIHVDMLVRKSTYSLINIHNIYNILYILYTDIHIHS